jgi:hypothetical protein
VVLGLDGETGAGEGDGEILWKGIDGFEEWERGAGGVGCVGCIDGGEGVDSDGESGCGEGSAGGCDGLGSE